MSIPEAVDPGMHPSECARAGGRPRACGIEACGQVHPRRPTSLRSSLGCVMAAFTRPPGSWSPGAARALVRTPRRRSAVKVSPIRRKREPVLCARPRSGEHSFREIASGRVVRWRNAKLVMDGHVRAPASIPICVPISSIFVSREIGGNARIGPA